MADTASLWSARMSFTALFAAVHDLPERPAVDTRTILRAFF